MPKLGVNIDHLATLREARKISYPSPIKGAEGILMMMICAN
jgi:pyridoxine 5'-phosphate synthase PdxJ